MRARFSKHGYPTPTKGHVALREVMRVRGSSTIAQELGTTRQTLHNLFRLARAPGRRVLEAMESILGIPKADFYTPASPEEEVAIEDGI